MKYRVPEQSGELPSWTAVSVIAMLRDVGGEGGLTFEEIVFLVESSGLSWNVSGIRWLLEEYRLAGAVEILS